MKVGIKTQKKNRLQLLHQYYHYTGFYDFIGATLRKTIVPVILFIGVLFLFNKYVYNINEGLQLITETFSSLGILLIFYFSESVLGLIPPEIFIAWAKKTTSPISMLVTLSTLSYLGGITSFFLGKSALKIDSVKKYLEVKMNKQLKNTSKWGGFLIVIGALLPVPFAITCMTAGMIKYPLKGVLLFGIFRYLRFAIYGYLIFNVVS